MSVMSAFRNVECIRYEEPNSKNPLSFRRYYANEVIEGRTIREHLNFSTAYWHTFRATGT